MPETQPAETVDDTPPAEAEAPAAPTELPTDHPLVKTLAAQKAELKELREKARRLGEIEDSQKTEAQRLSEAAVASQREAEEARAEATRYRVAAQFGVKPEFFDLLGSGDEAEITARAERIASLLSVTGENEQLKAELDALKAGRTPALNRPVADLKPGATPEPEPLPDTSYPSSWLPQRQPTN